MKRFNDWLAIKITGAVGTMYCAYLFAVIGIMGITGALTNNVNLVLIVGAVSGYFLQLVLLPIIIVGQNLQQNKTSQKIDEHHEAIKKHIDQHHAKLKKLVEKKQ
jgi:hypothetical protein